MVDDGILKATEFSLDDLTIISSTGIAIRLDQVVRELNIFEDLFGNIMSGNIFISDSQNLINVLPIVGAEYLKITLVKPSSPWRLEKTFRIYKITERKRTTAYTEDYVLSFCSEEGVLNESMKISKSYKGMTISQIIKDITTTYLHISSSKFPTNQLTQTTDVIDVVIPYWTPFYTINWLSRMARTGKFPGCSFVFFEDSKGFHFSPIESLSQQKPLQMINFMPVNFETDTSKDKTDKTDMEIKHEASERYELLGAPDLLRSIHTGMYAGRLVRIDPLSQKITITTLDGATQFNATQHVNGHTIIQTNKDRTATQQNEHFDAYFRVAADNLKVDTWMLQRNAYISALHEFQLSVVVPGNMNYRVGQVVTLNLPASTAPTRDKKPIDALFTGNYLITSIRHKIDRTKYVCILELSKDSVQTPIPVPIEGNPTLNEMRAS